MSSFVAVVTSHPARLAARPARQSAGQNLQGLARGRPLRVTHRSAAADAASGGIVEDAGSAFLQNFKSLADMPTAKPEVSNTSGGCCGGSDSAEDSAQKSGGGCGGGCGSSSQEPSVKEAATAVLNQLNSLMGGMEGTLSREDIRMAFEETRQAQDGGERFLDVAALLSGRPDFADDHDDELDALVV